MEVLGKKRFGIFIKALHKQAGDRQDYFVSELFAAIGADKISDIKLDDAVKNWVAGNNQSYKKRFKGKEFKQEQYNSCFQFLNERINVRFKDVQTELKSYSNEYRYIDFETDNQEVFFNSIVNQFMEIVGVPLPKRQILFTQDEDCHKKQEKASLSETPPEQIGKIFEQAMADYGIATYICKLPDYLIEEPFYAGDIFAFSDFIQTNVLAKFVNQQNENIYKKISEFNLALKTYSSFLSMIRLSVSEKYGIMLKMSGVNNEVIRLLDRDYDKMKTNLSREMPMEEKETDKPLTEEIKGELTQLEFLRSILLSYKQLCELFGEICPGKTTLVF